LLRLHYIELVFYRFFAGDLAPIYLKVKFLYLLNFREHIFEGHLVAIRQFTSITAITFTELAGLPPLPFLEIHLDDPRSVLLFAVNELFLIVFLVWQVLIEL